MAPTGQASQLTVQSISISSATGTCLGGGLTKSVGVLCIRGLVRIGTDTRPVRQEEDICLAFDIGPVSCVAGAFKCGHQGLVRDFELRWAIYISVDRRHNSCGTPWSLGSIVERQEQLESFLGSGIVCIAKLCCGVTGLRSDIQSEGINTRGLGFGDVDDPIIDCIGGSITNLKGINKLMMSIFKVGRRLFPNDMMGKHRFGDAGSKSLYWEIRCRCRCGATHHGNTQNA